MARCSLMGPTWALLMTEVGGSKEPYWIGLDIKFEINHMPLTTLSVAHNFNDFILKKENLTLSPMFQDESLTFCEIELVLDQF